MRTEKQRTAAAVRVKFVELWEGGCTNGPELALRLGQSRRNIERLVAQWRSGEMAEKMAQDRVLDAHEAGEPLPEDPKPDPRRAIGLPEDPGTDLDHMGVVRRILVSDRAENRDRIRAAQTIEQRRQWDLEHGINAGAKNLRLEDWMAMALDDIPKEARARLFGLLAEEMAAARTPWLSQPETTPEQIEVYHLLGLQVPAEDAAELAGMLAPARAAALDRAKELAGARAGPPPTQDPIDPEDYLTHVPV